MAYISLFCGQLESRDKDGFQSNYLSNSATLGRPGTSSMPGAEDVMSEMARRLKERKAKAEGTFSVSQCLTDFEYFCVDSADKLR